MYPFSKIEKCDFFHVKNFSAIKPPISNILLDDVKYCDVIKISS